MAGQKLLNLPGIVLQYFFWFAIMMAKIRGINNG